MAIAEFEILAVANVEDKLCELLDRYLAPIMGGNFDPARLGTAAAELWLVSIETAAKQLGAKPGLPFRPLNSTTGLQRSLGKKGL